ncbi:MAG TPA: LuxR C-terminal-related transcriptional regulator [Gaiellaceae bacterium]|nr:LuxR C-terminal-related transcriptional regulator [Gaiellaceae bacterium]
MSQPRDRSFRLLLASTRWAVHAYFISLRRRGLPGLVVAPIPPDAEAPDELALARATVVAIDAGLDAPRAVALARALRELDPSVPVLAVLCCPQSATPWQLQALVRVGASVLDLEAPPDEAVRVLQSVARGSSVLHVHLKRDHRAFLHEVLVGREGATDEKVRLLELLARGLPDHEIGRRLHLSPHTVKHRIEDLRAELGARNRIELAAWAGRNGFYAPEGHAVDSVPVQVLRSPPR